MRLIHMSINRPRLERLTTSPAPIFSTPRNGTLHMVAPSCLLRRRLASRAFLHREFQLLPRPLGVFQATASGSMVFGIGTAEYFEGGEFCDACALEGGVDACFALPLRQGVRGAAHAFALHVLACGAAIVAPSVYPSSAILHCIHQTRDGVYAFAVSC